MGIENESETRNELDAVLWSAQQMVDRMGGDEALVRALVSLFLTECPRRLDEIRTSVQGGQAEDIRRAAHAFKGMVSNFTSGRPTTVAFELEQLGRAGGVDEAPAVFERLDRDVASFMEALRVYDQTPSSCTS